MEAESRKPFKTETLNTPKASKSGEKALKLEISEYSLMNKLNTKTKTTLKQNKHQTQRLKKSVTHKIIQ